MPDEILSLKTLSVNEVCEATGFSKDFVYREIKNGRLKPATYGKPIRVRVKQLEEYMARNEEVGYVES